MRDRELAETYFRNALKDVPSETQLYLTGRYRVYHPYTPYSDANRPSKLALEIIDPIHNAAMLADGSLEHLIGGSPEPSMLVLVLAGYRVLTSTFAHPGYPLLVKIHPRSICSTFSQPIDGTYFAQWSNTPSLYKEFGDRLRRMGVTDFKLGMDFNREPKNECQPTHGYLCYADHEQWMLAKMALEGC